MRVNSLFIGTLALALSVPVGVQAANGAAAAMTPPDQVIHQTAEQIFSAVNSNRAELEKDPQKLDGLVGKILTPHFDLGEAARLVLGRYWRNATPTQRQAFQDAFYKYLVNAYANGLMKGNYSARSIKIEPWRGDASDTRAMIRTQVTLNGKPPVQVDYAMLRTPQGWKAFDVSVEGISYVLSYRNQFAPEIQHKGLDALIQRLQADASKAPAAQSHAG